MANIKANVLLLTFVLVTMNSGYEVITSLEDDFYELKLTQEKLKNTNFSIKFTAEVRSKVIPEPKDPSTKFRYEFKDNTPQQRHQIIDTTFHQVDFKVSYDPELVLHGTYTMVVRVLLEEHVFVLDRIDFEIPVKN